MGTNLKLVDASASAPLGRRQFAQKKASDPHGWRDAMEDFLLEKKGTVSEGTVDFYRDRLTQATNWLAEEARGGEGVPIEEFKVRDFTAYLASRVDVINPRTKERISVNTRRADGIALRALVKFAAQRGLIERNPITSDTKLPKRQRPYVAVPDKEWVRKLIKASEERWLISKNPDRMKFLTPKARTFFARRQHAILSTLVDGALRIGEVLGLRLSSYDREKKQISIRAADSKSNEPREIPISDGLIDTIDSYLRVRPKTSPTDYLFVTEYGTKINYWVIRKSLRRDCEFAGIPDMSYHKLRHFAATDIAKKDVWVAQQILGHSSIEVTKVYLHGDPEHVRRIHKEAGTLDSVTSSKQGGKGQSDRKKLI